MVVVVGMYVYAPPTSRFHPRTLVEQRGVHGGHADVALEFGVEELPEEDAGHALGLRGRGARAGLHDLQEAAEELEVGGAVELGLGLHSIHRGDLNQTKKSSLSTGGAPTWSALVSRSWA